MDAPTDVHELLAEEDPTPGATSSPPMAAWAVVAALAALLSAGALAGAGAALDAQGLGRSVARGGCDASLAGGLALLALAGLLAGLSRIAVERRHVHEVSFDLTRMVAGLAAPALALVAAAPAFLGCEGAVRLQDLGAIGDALLGTPGFAVAGAGAFGVGFALTTAVRIGVPVAAVVAEYERLRAGGADVDLVERALATHDLLEEGATLEGPLVEGLEERGEIVGESPDDRE